MAMLNDYTDPLRKPPLDDRLYSPSPDTLNFFKFQTGIQDEKALREHIITVQKQAYEYFGYPCIHNFSFTISKITQHSAWIDALKLRDEHPDAILLDVGCCFGTDIRKAVIGGWDVQNVIASDIQEGFWKCGHDLFRSTSETFPAVFVPGDVLQSGFIEPRAPFYEKPENNRPSLKSLTKSLTSVQGHISVIHASWFFHLFGEVQQLEVAQRLASLLSPAKGSVMFGSNLGLSEKGWQCSSKPGAYYRLFCHSPESWKELWDGQVFERGTVKVVAELHTLEGPLASGSANAFTSSDGTLRWLQWSVTRT